MKINPLTFLQYSFTNPEAWLMLVNQRIQHSKFGGGVIKEIRFGDSILKSSSATIQFDKKVESGVRGWTDTLDIALRAFNGRMITELSLPDELIEIVFTSSEREKTGQELEINQKKEWQLEEGKRPQFECGPRNDFVPAYNEQELKRIREKQSRAKSIQSFCIQSHITKLLHFTRLVRGAKLRMSGEMPS